MALAVTRAPRRNRNSAAPEPEVTWGRGGGEATGSKRSSDLWGQEVLDSHPRSRIIEWERAERRSACSAPSFRAVLQRGL